MRVYNPLNVVKWMVISIAVAWVLLAVFVLVSIFVVVMLVGMFVEWLMNARIR